MTELASEREQMLRQQIQNRGVRDAAVLRAMGRVRREAFVSAELADHAYEDRPLPIDGGQTISQPYIVAFMLEALALEEGDRVLEIGAGSGYAAAVMADIADEVYAIERIGELAEHATQRLAREGYQNVHIRHADGTLGWVEQAPFDAILVSAGAPAVPENILSQLAPGGRMVVPVGTHQRTQKLIRVTRGEGGEFEREELADVRFVPLIGQHGWDPDNTSPASPRLVSAKSGGHGTLPQRIAHQGETFESPADANYDALLQRIGDARVVLIGEASHGTSEFYRMRAAITRRLIEEHGFRIVAVEADWPDAARIDHYVRHKEATPSEWTAFSRFPTWMWRNVETQEFVDWLHAYNSSQDWQQRAGFYGLDLYSLYNSARAVIDYLEDIDPELAEVARLRYGCLSPWEADPAAYGQAALTGRYQDCERDVIAMLKSLYERRQRYAENDGARFLDAAQNAELVASAERYYRVMYYGSRDSWNLRDSHMFETLKRIMAGAGDNPRAVVWAHNSHIGDARATEMSARGEHNIGQLCRQAFDDASYHIGFGTDHGTVAAASNWDSEMEIKRVRPAHERSYERLFHLSEQPGLLLPLRDQESTELRNDLTQRRLERAIGVIYRPQSELASHYFEAQLTRQFDEYIWVNESSAVTPLASGQLHGVPDTYPFGL
tara:strand:+ start:23510 stop:25507 length:1998 start_codon:yes stop_codon:yes gene_type:complete